MKTEHHPYSTKIHYESVEYGSLCGRKFKEGTSELLESGYTGSQKVTCKGCKHKLTKKFKV